MMIFRSSWHGRKKVSISIISGRDIVVFFVFLFLVVVISNPNGFPTSYQNVTKCFRKKVLIANDATGY